jgi:hypothetical protein
MHQHVKDALEVLKSIGMPRAQINERSALCLLALVDLTPQKNWNEARLRLIGITPIMEFCAAQYHKRYAPNTRETFRRQSMHQFIDAGIALYNPDDPKRPVNSPKAVYQIEPAALELLRSYRSRSWNDKLVSYLSEHPSLKKRYAKERGHKQISLEICKGQNLNISPGPHSELIKAIVENFGPRFVPGGEVLYLGDTGNKWSICETSKLEKLGVQLDSHGKMPDVILYYPVKKWLILIESVTSHGPVDGKRHDELAKLFSEAKVGLVYVTAFPTRAVMSRYIGKIAWETEVWVADAPSHLIHFNGSRFLGPY